MHTVTTHPAWCSPARCEAHLGRFHSNEPVIIPSTATNPARFQVRIYGGGTAAPLIELIVGNTDTGERVRVDLTRHLARRVIASLESALTDSGDSRDGAQ